MTVTHVATDLQVSPEATWSSKQHRLRWVLPAIAAGDRGDLRAQFLPDTKADPLAAAGVLEGAAGELRRQRVPVSATQRHFAGAQVHEDGHPPSSARNVTVVTSGCRRPVRELVVRTASGLMPCMHGRPVTIQALCWKGRV